MTRFYGGVDTNMQAVLASIDDVADDIRHEMRKRVGRMMTLLKSRARQYVMEDASHRGALADSIHNSETGTRRKLKFKVSTDSAAAPYAAIVEYGSGQRTNKPWRGSEPPPPTELSTPKDFPYSSPDIDYNEANPYNLTGKNNFAGFVGHIEEWMATKPVTPRSGDMFTSAVAIAKVIIDKGNLAHPFMRPAWFDTELRVRKAAKNALKNATR